MTLEERLALARELAARTAPRFVVDNSREEARKKSFERAKRHSEMLKRSRARAASRDVGRAKKRRGSRSRPLKLKSSMELKGFAEVTVPWVAAREVDRWHPQLRLEPCNGQFYHRN